MDKVGCSAFEIPDGVSANGQVDAALGHMISALHILDRNLAVPGIVGARLQHAIDTLCDELGLDQDFQAPEVSAHSGGRHLPPT